jgi:hypothetical protein
MATSSTLKSGLRARLVSPPLRWLLKPVFDGTVAAQLSALRARDWALSRAPSAAGLGVTAIVKTFERPRLLARLLSSLARCFPGLPVIVADDSRCPRTWPGVRTLSLAYDSGVSAGRQAALEQVQTELTWVLDDDFIVHSGTQLERVVSTLRAQPRLDILGGQVVDLPLLRRRGSPRDPIYPTSRAPLLPLGTLLGSAEVCDKVPNFFVGRTQRLRLVGWDARLRRVEHADFFTRARGRLVTAFDARFWCLHAQAPFDEVYMRGRLDVGADEQLLRERHFG